MIKALAGLMIAILAAIVAYENHDTGLVLVFVIGGILHALYRVRRGG